MVVESVIAKAAARVQPPDPARDQPAADVVAFGSGGERGERDLGDFGVRDQTLFAFVPDRVRVVDRVALPRQRRLRLTACTTAGTGWQEMTALVTPGHWDRVGGNEGART